MSSFFFSNHYLRMMKGFDHLPSFDILGVKENVVAGNKVARWTSDLQNLVPNTGEESIFYQKSDS